MVSLLHDVLHFSSDSRHLYIGMVEVRTVASVTENTYLKQQNTFGFNLNNYTM